MRKMLRAADSSGLPLHYAAQSVAVNQFLAHNNNYSSSYFVFFTSVLCGGKSIGVKQTTEAWISEVSVVWKYLAAQVF
jgi:hypothetical protein